MVLLQLTVSRKSRNQKAVFKLAKYEELIPRLRRDGHPTRLLALEVSARCLFCTLAYDAFKQLELREQSRSRALKRLGEVAERGSCWLMSTRNGR